MNGSDGQIVIKVDLDDNKAQQGLDGINKKTGQLDKNAQSKFKGISKGLGTVGLAAGGVVTAIGAAGVAIGALAAPLVKAAAETQALNAQFDQVFGDLGSEAQNTINELGKQFGSLPDRIKPAFTQLTAQFKGIGLGTAEAAEQATLATTAVADAAAFYDTSFENANAALNSFIKGNYEGGEAIGLFGSEAQIAAFAVEQGIASSTSEFSGLSEAIKQTTRLNFARTMQENAGATGQAARESDGLENVLGNLNQAWENLKATLGSFILEPAIAGIKLLTSVLESINIQSVIDKFKQLTTSSSNETSFIQQNFEQFKQGIEIITQALFDYVVPFFREQLQVIKDFWDENGAQVLAAVKNAFNLVKAVFEFILPAILFVVKFVWGAIKDVISGALNVIIGAIKIFSGLFTGDWAKLWEGIKQYLSGAVKLILGIMSLTFVGGIRTALTNLAKLALNIVKNKWTSIINFFKNGAKNAIDSSKNLASGVIKWFKDLSTKGITAVKNLFTNTRTVFNNLVTNSVAKAKELASRFVAALKDLATKGVEQVRSASTQMVDKIRELPSKFFSAGKDIIQGLINGIRNLNPVSVIADIAGNMLDRAKKIWGINSPSRVFKQYGKWLMQGLAIGINDDYEKVTKAVASIGQQLIEQTERITKQALAADAAARKNVQAEVKRIEEQQAKDRAAITKKLNEDIAKLRAKENASTVKNAKKLASDIAKLEQKATEQRKKVNATAEKAVNKVIQDSAKTRLAYIKQEVDRRIQLDNLSVREQEQYWKAILNTYTKGSKEYLEVLKLYNAASEALQKEELENVTNYISERKELGSLSVKDEAIIWEQALKALTKGSKEYEKALKNYRDTTRQLYNDTISINENYLEQLTRVNNELINQIKDLEDTYNNALSGGIEKLLGQLSVFEAFEIERRTGQELQDNLDSQVLALETFVKEFERISKRGINETLLQELRDLGVKALPELIALNELTDEELQEYSKTFERAQKLATDFVTEELAETNKETIKAIQKLKDNATVELGGLSEAWINAIKEITDSTEKEFLTFDKIGQEAAQQLIDGLKSLESPLDKQAREIGQSIKDAIAEGLGVDLSGLNIVNSLRNTPLTTGLTTDNGIQSLYNGSNAYNNGGNDGSVIEINPTPVLVDGKQLATILYGHSETIQSNNFSIAQTLKGVTTN